MLSLIKFIKCLTSYKHSRFFDSSSWIEVRDSEPNMVQLARVPEVFLLSCGMRRVFAEAGSERFHCCSRRSLIFD